MPQEVKIILNKGLRSKSEKMLGARGAVGCGDYKIPVESKHSKLCQRSKR